MTVYYDFQATNDEISYKPYLYDRGDIVMHFVIAVIAIAGGFGLTHFGVFGDGVIVGGIIGAIVLIKGLYDLAKGKEKISLIFDKKTDALYEASRFRKRKLIALGDIYEIIVVSENMSNTYAVTGKKNPSADAIAITSFITKKRENTPEILFLEQEILPALHAFLAI